MKIGQVAREYNISIDTINYYVNFGLLVPSKKNGQRDFNDQTIKDLELLLELKDLRFSLNDIHQIISLYRISDLACEQDTEDLIKRYLAKKFEYAKEIEDLNALSGIIDKTIQKLRDNMPLSKKSIGLPLSLMHLLCCPTCRKDLNIINPQMNTKYVFRGNLMCSCGYAAEICDGIILTPNKNIDAHDEPDINRKMYKDLPPKLITLFQNSYNWMLHKIDEIQFSGKVILETYINAWFFLHNHQQYLDHGGKYIIIDKYPETLASYKRIIEDQEFEHDILYIADSSTKFPIKHECVDVNIDFFAINEHNFYHQSFLLDELKPYFSRKVHLLGTYFYFKNGKKSMQQLLKEYPTSAGHNFQLEYFYRKTEKKYHFLSQANIGHTTYSGNNIGFSFHVKGEEMHLLSYLAKPI